MSASRRLHLVITHATRALDAEDAVDQHTRGHGYRLSGDHPRYELLLGAADGATLSAGRLPGPLAALLTDLVHDEHIRSLGVAWQSAGAPLEANVISRLEIGSFIALAREARLAPDVWYRLHAPAGFRCRPKRFA